MSECGGGGGQPYWAELLWTEPCALCIPNWAIKLTGYRASSCFLPVSRPLIQAGRTWQKHMVHKKNKKLKSSKLFSMQMKGYLDGLCVWGAGIYIVIRFVLLLLASNSDLNAGDDVIMRLTFTSQWIKATGILVWNLACAEIPYCIYVRWKTDIVAGFCFRPALDAHSSGFL